MKSEIFKLRNTIIFIVLFVCPLYSFAQEDNAIYQFVKNPAELKDLQNDVLFEMASNPIFKNGSYNTTIIVNKDESVEVERIILKGVEDSKPIRDELTSLIESKKANKCGYHNGEPVRTEAYLFLKLNDEVREEASKNNITWSSELFSNPSFYAFHKKELNESYNNTEYYGEIKISEDKKYFYCLEIEKKYFGSGKVKSIDSTESFYEVTEIVKNGYGNFFVKLNFKYQILNQLGNKTEYDHSSDNSLKYKWAIKPMNRNTYSSYGIKKVDCATCTSHSGFGEYSIKINRL